MNALDTLDEAFDVKANPKKVLVNPQPEWLPNGYYTLTMPCGSHRTFRLYTQQNGPFAGKRLMGLLIGPVNTSDFEDFGFLEPTGFKIWKRFLNHKQATYAELIWCLASGEMIDGHSLLISKRCLCCNRTLTTPESYANGIGPVCQAKLLRG